MVRLEKTLTVLSHGDSDGVVSASLVKAAMKESYDNVRIFFTHPVGLYEDFKEFAKGDVVILDIAVSESHALQIAKLFRKYRGNIIYIDHHPPPLSISLKELDAEIVREDEDVSASELTFKRFQESLPEDYDRVALYGAIGDYADTTNWVITHMQKWDKRQIYFEAGVLVQGLEGSRRMHDFKRHVVDHLSKNNRPSQLSELIVRALIQVVNNEELYHWVKANVKTAGSVAYVIDPPGSLGVAATYSLGITGAKIGLSAESRGDYLVMSLRTYKGIIDLNKALRKITSYIGGCGGGHPTAAGARIPREKLHTLIEELNAYISFK